MLVAHGDIFGLASGNDVCCTAAGNKKSGNNFMNRCMRFANLCKTSKNGIKRCHF